MKGKATYPVFWPGEFHGLYSPWGRRESDTTERLSLSWNGTCLYVRDLLYTKVRMVTFQLKCDGSSLETLRMKEVLVIM